MMLKQCIALAFMPYVNNKGPDQATRLFYSTQWTSMILVRLHK